MTMCNMTIEAGGRAGMVAPDDTTLEWVEGRPAAPRADARRRVAGAAHRRGRASSTPRSRSTPRRSRPRSPGAPPRRWSPRSPSRYPSRRPRATSARWSTWRSKPAPRYRRSSSTASSSARAPTRASATCARPPRWSRGARWPATSLRWWCRAPPQVKAQAEEEGLDEVFRAAGFDWRSAGCSMCLGMNPDIAAPGERVASTSNRNFEGRQGRGARSHLVSPEDGGRGGHRGPLRRHQGVVVNKVEKVRGPISVLHRARRRHRPDHPQAVPQAGGALGVRRVPVLRLGQGARLGPGPATRSWSPGATSAAAPRASTRRGRWRTSASRCWWRPRSPTSSTPTAPRSGCCRCRCPRRRWRR